MRTLFKLGFGITIVLSLARCGDDSSSSSTSQTYSGRGSKWELTLDTAALTFTGQDISTTPPTAVSGPFADQSNGFRKFTVSSSSGPNAPAVGTTTFAVIIPGVAILAKPFLAGESKPITLVRKGTCPGQKAYNWISAHISSSDDTSSSTRDYFGRFTWNGTNTINVATGYSLTALTTNLLTGSESYTGSCTDGIITAGTDADGGKIYLTEAGPGFIATSGGQNIFGVPADALSAQTSLAGTYAGLVYSPTGSTVAGNFFPASVTVNAAGTSGAMSIYNSSDVGATETGTGTLALNTINSPSDGLVRGTITVSGSSSNMAWGVLTNVAGSGKTAIFGIGQRPGDTAKGYLTLLVSYSSSTAATKTNFFFASMNWIKGLFK